MANDEIVEKQTELPLEDNTTEGKIVEQESHRPEDVAAAFFRLNERKLDMLISKLAPYQMRELIKYVATYPLSSSSYMPTTVEEKQFAYLFSEMVFNKSIMQLSYEAEKLAEAEKAATIQEEVKVIQEDNTGSNNG